MKKRRIFFAILPPEEIRNSVLRLIERFKKNPKTCSLPIRWEDPQKIHITIIFMGMLNQQKIEKISKIADILASRTPKYTLFAGKVNYLFKKHQDSIIYLEIEDKNKRYLNFFKEFTNTLKENGFYPPSRAGLHLTIGRLKKVRYPSHKKQILLTVSENSEGVYKEFGVSKFYLMESIFDPKINTTSFHPLRDFNLNQNQPNSLIH